MAAPMSPPSPSSRRRPPLLLLAAASSSFAAHRVDVVDWRSRRAASNQGARLRLNVCEGVGRAARIRFGVRRVVRGESPIKALQPGRRVAARDGFFPQLHAQVCSSGESSKETGLRVSESVRRSAYNRVPRIERSSRSGSPDDSSRVAAACAAGLALFGYYCQLSAGLFPRGM